MSLQEIVYRGSVVSTGAPQVISFPAGFDQFHLRNRTTHAAGAGITDSYWTAGDPAGWATTDTVAGGVITRNVIAAAGYTYSDSSTAVLGPAIAITAISQAGSAVANTGTTPVVGDIVRIYGTTAQLQSSGLDFTVTAVNAGVSMTFGYFNTAGFAAAATAGFYRRLPFDLPFFPRKRYITGITAAASAVVTLSVAHGYVVGEKVIFHVSAAFGMTQINGLTGTITAITTGATNTITVDINSAAFTAFAFPTSAVAALGITHAHITPAGEIPSVLAGAIRDAGTRQIYIGTAIQGTAGDIFDYWVSRSQS